MTIRYITLPSGDLASYDDELTTYHDAMRRAIERFPDMYGVVTPEDTSSDLVRGFTNYLPQLKEMGGAGVALTGEAMERQFGAGPVSGALKGYGADVITTAKGEVVSKPSDTFTEALAKGPGTVLTDWLPYQVGQGVGNLAEMGLVALGGSMIGGSPLTPTGVATGLGSLVMKEAAKKILEEKAKDILAKSTKAQADAYLKKELGKSLGVKAGLAGAAGFHGVGEVGTRAIEELGIEGVDYETMVPSMGAHAALELVGDIVLAKALGFGKAPSAPIPQVPSGLGSFAGQVGKGIAVTGTKEAPVEIGQTVAERFGAHLPLTGPEATKEYIDAAAAAYGMSAMPGGVGGARAYLEGQQPPAPVTPPLPEAGLDALRPALSPTGEGTQGTLGGDLAPGSVVTPPITEEATPPSYRKDIEKQLTAAGADIETATVTALPTEESKQNYSYLRKLGLSRNAAITQALTLPQVAQEGQGMLFTRGPKGAIKYPEAPAVTAAPPASIPVVQAEPPASLTAPPRVPAETEAEVQRRQELTAQVDHLTQRLREFGDKVPPLPSLPAKGMARSNARLSTYADVLTKRLTAKITEEQRIAAQRRQEVEQRQARRAETTPGTVQDIFSGEMAQPLPPVTPVARTTLSEDLMKKAGLLKQKKTSNWMKSAYAEGRYDELLPELEQHAQNAQNPKQTAAAHSLMDQVRAAQQVVAAQPAVETTPDTQTLPMFTVPKTSGKTAVPSKWAKQPVSQPTQGEQRAVQIEKPSEGVLRPEGKEPQVEVGLPGVVEEVAAPKEVAPEGEAKEKVVKPKEARTETEAAARKQTREDWNDLKADDQPAFDDLHHDAQTLAITKRDLNAGQLRGKDFTAVVAEDVKAKARKEEPAGRAITESKPTELLDELADAENELKGVTTPARERELKAQIKAIKKKALDEENIKLSETAGAENPISAESLTSRLKGMFRAAPLFDKIVTIYPTQAEAVAKGALSEKAGHVAGFATTDGKVGLIAENIEDGEELSVFLHEVGVHLGMEKLIGKSSMTWLDSKILEWNELNDGSPESIAAKDAVRRSEKSTTDDNAEGRIAYMVEELVKNGMKPGVVGPSALDVWFQRVWSAMQDALKSLGIRSDKLSGQNLVDLAFGAAGIELGRTDIIDTTTKEGAAVALRRSEDRLGKTPEAGVGRKKMLTDEADRRKTQVESTKLSEVAPPGSENRIKASLAKMGEMAEPTTKDLSKLAALMPFTRDLIKWASKHMQSATKFWDLVNDRMALTRKWSLRVHGVSQSFLDLPQAAQDKVQKFLFDGKMSGNWGFVPEWHKDKDALPRSPEMERRWKAMDEAEQRVAEEVLKLGYETRVSHVDAIRKSIESAKEYSLTLTDEEAKTELDRDVRVELQKLGMWEQYRGPYIPTMRFGDYFVEAMSKEYADAKANGDEAKMTELKSDGDHYFYYQDKTIQAVAAKKKELEATGKYIGGMQFGPKTDRAQNRKADFAAVFRLETLIRKRADREGAMQLRTLLRELTRDMAEEYAEVQSRQQFKAVSGAKWEEVMRGVAVRGQQVAFEIGALTHNREIAKTLYEMEKESRKADDSVVATHLFNELQNRYTTSLDAREISEGVQRILAGVSFWKLLTNPSYYLVQLLQPFQYSLPSMYRYFGVGESWSELMKTRSVIANVLKISGGVKRVADDLSWVGDKDNAERQMLEWLQQRNLLDIGMESEIGALSGAHQVNQFLERHAVRPLRNAVQNVEIVNRVSTALAVYRLGMAKGWSETQAREAVEQVVSDTHGNYAGFNAPRFLNTKGIARIPLQFRKFQLIQATFLYKNLVEEIRGLKGATREEKRASARVVAGTLGHTLAMAGLKGSVLWVAASLLVKAFDDDEEDPRSVESKVHAWLKGKTSEGFADLAMYGLPTVANVNISSRAAQNPLSVLPFDNHSLLDAFSDKEKLRENAFALFGGAAAGLLSDVVDGFDQIRDGDYYKGVATMSPSALKNLMRAGQYATKGSTQRDGDVTLTPEEVTQWGTVQQMLGITPTKLHEAYRVSGEVRNVRTAFSEQYTEIKRDYVDAVNDRDRESAVDAMKRLQKLQTAMRKMGLTPPKKQDLIKAPKEKQKREASMVRGVETTKATRGLVEML